MFVLSLKQPVFNVLRDELKSSPDELIAEIWTAGSLLDRLAIQTVDSALEGRDEVILRQQQEMMELSTPVVKLWDGVLALPLIGTLDSARTQVVMESLLSAIVETNSQIAIIDITGVPTVDTLVAQHLIKTITAARLMGADCYLSGIRPAIAQTIVHLGIDLVDVQTKAKLADASPEQLTRGGSVSAFDFGPDFALFLKSTLTALPGPSVRVVWLPLANGRMLLKPWSMPFSSL